MNTQAPEKVTEVSGTEKDFLDVQEVFLTIQGEGPFAGQRAVFIRLAGCNLQCPLCDTDYTSKRSMVSVKDLCNKVTQFTPADAKRGRLIVLTGGEPFRQPHIRGLISLLIQSKYIVQVETNGAVAIPNALPMQTYLICSPKTPQIHYTVRDNLDAWKYIIQAGMVAEDGLPRTSLGMHQEPARPTPGENNVPIYLQPADEGDTVLNNANLQEAVNSCMKHGYTLSLQQHKLIGLP
jgi:organic radical activating enzyme